MGTRLNGAADVTARVLVGTVVAMLVLATAPLLLGWRSDVVLTGSMLPGIAPGDVVVSRPVDAADVAAGQVVLVANPARPGTTLVHRVVRRQPDGSLVTKGDANAAPDSTPVPPDDVRGLPRVRVPYVGLPIVWAGSGQYLPLAALAGVVVLLGYLRSTTRRPRTARHRVAA